MLTYKHKYLLHKMKRYKTMYLFLLPAIVSVIIFAYVPMGGILMAFQDYDIIKGLAGSEWAGLTHFKKFMSDASFYNAVKNTVVINVLGITFGFPIPIALSIMIFSMKNSKFKKITQTVSYLPHFVSWVVVAGLVYKVLDINTGIVNVILRALQLEPVPFMRELNCFWPIITITGIWKELGWSSIIYLATLSSIPAEQYESAIVDGANGRQKLIYITLPGMMDTIGLLFIFTIGSLIRDNFEAVYNLSNPFLASRATTIEYYVFLSGIVNDDISLATAVGLAQSLISLALVCMANAVSRKVRGHGAF